MKRLKKIVIYIGAVLLLFVIFNAIRIYNYSFEYSERKSDVAIILGAGTNNGVLSPVFTERVNHGIYLYQNQLVGKIILTGGIGEGQSISDSEVAKRYAIENGVPAVDLLIETHSNYTYENLSEAKRLMDALNFSSALIVSDPLHMKRSMELAISINIECKPSPTKTSMYRTTFPKLKSLIYETFYYTMGKLAFRH